MAVRLSLQHDICRVKMKLTRIHAVGAHRQDSLSDRNLWIQLQLLLRTHIKVIKSIYALNVERIREHVTLFPVFGPCQTHRIQDFNAARPVSIQLTSVTSASVHSRHA